jgi:outer membrane receptor protein involved in Fe transport
MPLQPSARLDSYEITAAIGAGGMVQRFVMGVIVWLGAVLCLAGPAEALEGRVLDARTGQPVAGAEVSLVGYRGVVKTDRDGRFTWSPDPKLPFVAVVVLPSGQAARPVTVTRLDGRPVELLADTSLTDATTVSGVAPSIDAAPAAAATRLSAHDIALRLPATLSQALETLPGLGHLGEGRGATPAIRGLARGRTLILIDGVRVASERRAGPNASFLDPLDLHSIDVTRGPGSVAYGSDALGGVISVRGPRPDHSPGARFMVATTAGAGTPVRRASLRASVGLGDGGLLLAARAREADDYDSPEGQVVNSAWRDRGFLARMEHRAGSGLWTVGWRSDWARDIGRPRSDVDAVLAMTPVEDSHRFTTSYDRTELAGFGRVAVSGLVAFSRDRTDQDRLPTPRRPRNVERSDISAHDFQVRATGERTLGVTRLLVGLDVHGRHGLKARTTSTAFGPTDRPVRTTETLAIEDARRTDVGLFAQFETDVASGVGLAGGVRGDIVTTRSRGEAFGRRSTSSSAVAGFAAARVGPFDGWSVTAQVSRGFRDPTLSDRFFRGPVGRGIVEGNPALEPETSLQLDVDWTSALAWRSKSRATSPTAGRSMTRRRSTTWSPPRSSCWCASSVEISGRRSCDSPQRAEMPSPGRVR